MTKGQIYFSNDLAYLAEVFKQNLLASGKPFERRLVIVPHLGLKSFLMRFLAKDPDLQVAAGLEIANFSQGFTKMSRHPIPTTLELSLFLQQVLIGLINKEDELKKYFDTEAKEERIGPFCDTLARYFQRYGVYGKGPLVAWQEKLWAKTVQAYKFPKNALIYPSGFQLHVFGASFIPKVYLDHYIRQEALLYLFSPCEIFWGDYYTEKEKQWLQKDLTAPQQDLFASSFEDQNPLLASWGKMGRKMFLLLEETQMPTEDYYSEPLGQSSLAQLQRDILSGSVSKPKSDESLQCVSASSRFCEIELLKNFLLTLCHQKGVKLNQIQVLAPDISLYFSSIEALFSDIPYEVSDLELIQLDPVAKAFKKLIALIPNRFSLDSLLELFQAAPFKEKFNLKPEIIEKWLKAAHINWGFSEEQRKALLPGHAARSIGTWEWGLQRLILGLGDLKGLAAIEITEMEMFNRLYFLMHSLADDLSVLYDGTKWTISTWLRYFCALLESYFVIEPTEDMYQELQRYATVVDGFDENEVAFASMERVIEQILHQKTKIASSSNLQSISFNSLSEGVMRPCQVVCLIGMDEESFPFKEQANSLCVSEQDYRPTSQDCSRFNFLQALLMAKESVYISYVRDNQVSPVVQELLDYLDGAEIVSHSPSNPCAAQKVSPLIKEFYEPINVPSISPLEQVDAQKLFKFARHPLRYYFHEVLGIYPERPPFAESEYFLNPLTKIELAKQALSTPLEEVLSQAKERGELPAEPLIPLAVEQVVKELENWQMTLEAFGIAPHQIQTKTIRLQVGPTQIQGKLELYTPQGLLVRGTDSLEDKIRFWPQALIMQELGQRVILIKDQKTLEVVGSLEDYLSYFALSHKVCSPLIPEIAKALLEKSDLKKALKKLEDESFSWLLMRDGMPCPQAIFHNWGDRLAEIFGGVDATV